MLRPRERRSYVVLVVLGGALAWSAPGAVASPAYVTNVYSGTVTPFDPATRAVGTPIHVGDLATDIAVSPDGRTAYATAQGAGVVTPIDVASGVPGPPIPAGTKPTAIAITPDGATAFVTDVGGDQVIPIDLSTRTPGVPIPAEEDPVAVAITPDGTTAYVANDYRQTITVIDIPTRAVRETRWASIPIDISFSPAGTTAYLLQSNGDFQTMDVASGRIGAPIQAGLEGGDAAVSPSGTTALVSSPGDQSAAQVDLASFTSTRRVRAGSRPAGVAFAPDGLTAVVANEQTWNLTPVDVTTGTPGAAISAGAFPHAVVFVPDQGPTARFTVVPGSVGARTTLDARASSDQDGSVASFAWDFGDGTTAVTADATISHDYTSAGPYRIRLTVTDDAGCSTTVVFTGQTAACNGSDAGTTEQLATVANAPKQDAPPEQVDSSVAVAPTAADVPGVAASSSSIEPDAAQPADLPRVAPRRCTVPDVHGLRLASARRLMARHGCGVGRVTRSRHYAHGVFRVVGQSLHPGTGHRENARVGLVLRASRSH